MIRHVQRSFRRAALILPLGTAAFCVTPVHAAPGLLVQAEATSKTLDCGGGAAEVQGNRNTLELRGDCTALTVRGDGNQVQVVLAAGARIHVEGQTNRVSWTVPPQAAAPVVTVAGRDDVVAAATPVAMSAPAVPSPAASREASGLLWGDDVQRDAACSAANPEVVVEGTRGAWRITGGCHGLILRGQRLTVQAELAPGARVLLEGEGNLLLWTQPQRGAPPSMTVSGKGSKAARVAALGP